MPLLTGAEVSRTHTPRSGADARLAPTFGKPDELADYKNHTDLASAMTVHGSGLQINANFDAGNIEVARGVCRE